MLKTMKLLMIKDILESDPTVLSADVQDDIVAFWLNTDPHDNSWVQLDDSTRDRLKKIGVDYGECVVFNDCPGLYNEGMICIDDICGHKLCER